MAEFIDVGKQVVTKREDSLLDTGLVGVRLALAFLQRGLERIEAAEQQIVLVVEVRLERCAANVGPIDDVLNRKLFEALLLDQCKKGFSKQMLRPLYASVLFRGHPASLVFEQLGLV